MSGVKKTTTLTRLETIILNALSALKVNVSDYCEIETTDGRYNIVLSNGALMTIIAYDGTRTIVGNETFNDFITSLTNRLSVYLAKSGHQFAMTFRRDLNPTSDLFNIAEIQKNTAKNLNLKLDGIIDEAVEVYSKYIYDETNFLVLYSHPSLLDESEIALEAKKKNLLYKKYKIPAFNDGQNILLVNSYLKSQHETYVESTLSVFNNPDFAAQAKKLEVEDAIRSIKKAVSPMNTDQNWQPSIPYSRFVGRVPVRWKTSLVADDIGNHMWEPLPQQIMRSTIAGIDRASAGTYPIGSVITENRIYSPLLIATPPRTLVSFNELFANLNNASTTLPDGEERALPYAITFMLTGDGMANTAMKKTLAKVLAVASTENNFIKGAFEYLTDFQDNGGTVVGLSISVMTWAENNNFGIDEIQVRRSKLWRTMEAWGGAQVIEKGGDPVLGFTSCVHALTAKHHAPKFAAPLWDALHFMPWCRQASPFSMGTIMHRSIDGKLMKQEAFSSELTTWIKIYQGKPGSGKSVAMNNDIVEACLMPGLQRLPLISITDVGPSSRGAIEMIADHLPDDQKHLSVYKRLKNDAKHAINFLDCAVGRMKPTPNETAQMVAFLSTLITPIEARGKPEKGLSNFLSLVVELTFESKMEGIESGRPNMYELHKDPALDQLLEDAGIDPRGRSYFELVDICHNKKLYRTRDLCHRYAMPKLGDTITTVSTNPEIKTRYESAMSENSGTIIEMFIRGVQEAISMYPVFADHTKFDVDQARVVSLDLQEVIGTNPKQSSLFFQIARIFAKKRMAFDESDIPSFPPNYHDYYRKLIEEVSEDKKIIAYDEMHNAKCDESLFNELKRDCREARKWGLELKFASQMMEDFEDIPQLATQFVIADRGTPQSREYLRGVIALKPEEEQALANYVNLGPGGLTYFSKTVTKYGTYSCLLTLTMGPQRLWALTTDADDRLLRKTMYNMLGDQPYALKLLSIAYPTGARRAMNARREALRKTDNANLNKEDEVMSIARVMAREIIDNQDYLLASVKKRRLSS